MDLQNFDNSFGFMQKLSLELWKLNFSMLNECNITPSPNSNPNPKIDKIEPFFYVHKESLDG